MALIPARQGSKRVPGKNIRVLRGHPLVAYTIAPALESGVFDAVVVSTDSEAIGAVARHYGADVPFLRPAALAGDTSPDIDWVEFTLNALRQQGRSYDCFSLLRPTSPFRTPDTIRRAWAAFRGEPGVDSLRAVERCAQHPAKMWIVRGNRLLPLLPFGPAEQPWHSSQYQSLPLVYVQNASLELAWSRVVFEGRTIAGATIVPFFTSEGEGFDINTATDWIVAEQLLEAGSVALPAVPEQPYGTKDTTVVSS
ncbi:MAG TPA: acylneuraminate cytidylyltransferase family protein [Candidatus Limnocylindrales bacterium]|nr:acylneuraminate cytidylyltransferase family protein [Candidatus Limnocylindrales bacterium]